MYRLTGRLEQSQLADLFRGERIDGATREPVIIKLFHLKTTDAAYAQVMADTARQLQAIAHAGVAHVLDVGLVDGQLAIVRQDTGRVTLGLALQRLNTREVILPPALALAIALELLDAVGAAHGAGVVHGALTPGNIVLGDDGRVSVADFGALVALQASPALRKTFGGRGRGSYRAPELGAGDPPTIAADLYALGAIIYELLTLREASTGSAAVSTRQERLPPPSRLVRRLQARIDPVIMRALESSPARRHRTCADFADGIRDFLSASGGIPPKDDLRKFVAELFPNEVQVLASGPVPIERAFELTDLAGVGAMEADEVEPTNAERPSFSGGRVDERTPTSDGLPVFADVAPAAEAMTQPLPPPREALETQPEVQAVARRAVPDWEAPPAAVPAPTAAQAGPTPQDPLKGRVRVVEDFASVEGQPKPQPPKQSARQRVAKTIMTFAVPFKRPGDPSVPSYDELEKRGARQVRWVSFIATFVLFGTISGAVYAFLRSTPDPKATLIGYLPRPIQELFPQQEFRPPPPPTGGKPLKLADFDKLHPDKAFNPNPQPETATTPAKPKEPEPPEVTPAPKKPAANANCYDAGKGAKTGFLTVESPVGVRVEIDGKRVCVTATKIPVAVGMHKITITEPKTKQEFSTNARFEAGKVMKLLPGFQRR
ncbi:MAG: serine/threonine protein kinase [Myxococcota bacterium]